MPHTIQRKGVNELFPFVFRERVMVVVPVFGLLQWNKPPAHLRTMRRAHNALDCRFPMPVFVFGIKARLITVPRAMGDPLGAWVGLVFNHVLTAHACTSCT